MLTVILVLLILADSWTTHRVLHAGGREANPLTRWLLHHIGLAGWTALKVGLVLLAALAEQPWLLAGLCVLYAGAVVINLLRMFPPRTPGKGG